MQPRHHQHVKHACLLKIHRLRLIHQTPVAQQHRPQDSRRLRRIGIERIQSLTKQGPQPRQPRPHRRRRRRNSLQQGTSSQRRQQMNILLRQIFPPVKRSRIPENQRQLRQRQHRYFIPRMNLRQRRLAFLRRKSHPHSARNRNHPLHRFHATNFHLQSPPPITPPHSPNPPPTPP